MEMGRIDFVLSRDSAISHKQFLLDLSFEKAW